MIGLLIGAAALALMLAWLLMFSALREVAELLEDIAITLVEIRDGKKATDDLP